MQATTEFRAELENDLVSILNQLEWLKCDCAEATSGPCNRCSIKSDIKFLIVQVREDKLRDAVMADPQFGVKMLTARGFQGVNAAGLEREAYLSNVARKHGLPESYIKAP